MFWLEALVPVLVLCWPIVGAYTLARVLRLPDTRSPLRRSALWLAVAGLIAVHFATLPTIERKSFLGIFYLLIVWSASEAVWFGLVVPLVRRGRPEYEPVPVAPRGSTRTALLAGRRPGGSLPRWVWGVGWSVFAVCITIVALIPETEKRWLLLYGMSVIWLMHAYWAARDGSIRPEPEPIADRASPDLLAAYARLRRLKAWDQYWRGVVFSLAGALLALWSVHEGWPPARYQLGMIWWVILLVIGSFAGTLIAFRRGEIVALRKSLGEDPSRRGRSFVSSRDA